MRRCFKPRLCVLCLVVMAAAASGIATPVCAQERGDTVRWRLDYHVYPLQDVTRYDLWGLGQDRVDESFRRVLRPMVWTPPVQGLEFAGVTTALGRVERRGNAECPQLLQSFNPATNLWAVPESAPSFDPWVVALKQAGRAGQQRLPLAAYDDMGSPINLAEIEARMRGAGNGAMAGGLIGALVGGGLGAALGLSICPIEILGPGCSPRDEAYMTVAIISGIVWGIAGGAFVGSEIGTIDRWEALEKIRAERRRAPTSGGNQ